MALATSLLHSIQVSANQCEAIRKAMLPFEGLSQRSRLPEFGRAVEITLYESLARQQVDAYAFGGNCAAAYVYALSLIEDTNRFGVWLAKQEKEVSDAEWDVVLESFAYYSEMLSQANAALRDVEVAIKPFVPKKLMELRFGLEPD